MSEATRVLRPGRRQIGRDMIGQETQLPADDRARLVRRFVEGRHKDTCRQRRRVKHVNGPWENLSFGRLNPRGLATCGRTT